MEIIVGKASGFCFGVKKAIDGAERELQENRTVYCLGKIIHNEEVIKGLERKGLVIIDNIYDAKDDVIIRAHGVPKYVYDVAKEENIKLLDYTCPFVLKIHETALMYSKNNYFIFLLGVKTHPETIGTISFCGNNFYLIENFDDIAPAIDKFNNSNMNDLLVISQTTFSVSLFENIINEIKNNIPSKVNLEIKNTICKTTSIRQKETEEIAKKVDLMIIIGDKHSSNTKKLYEIANENCINSILIQTKDDINHEYLQKFNRIGIMAGASTPQNIIQSVKQLCYEIKK